MEIQSIGEGTYKIVLEYNGHSGLMVKYVNPFRIK
jgi:hypothetical protein